MHWGDGYGWMGAGWGLMGLFWVLVIVGIVVLLRLFAGGGNSSNGAGNGGDSGPEAPPKSALDILKERYARGEIEREEFERMRRDLEK